MRMNLKEGSWKNFDLENSFILFIDVIVCVKGLIRDWLG